MRKEGVDAVIYMKRHATLKAKKAVLSASGAILINEQIEPEFVDVVTTIHPVTEKEEVYFDSSLSRLHPWRMVSRDRDPNSRAVVIAKQPSEPTAREVRQVLQGSGHAGADVAKVFGENRVELVAGPNAVGAFNCPGCIADDRAAAVDDAAIRKNPIIPGQVVCHHCNRNIEYRRWKLSSEATFQVSGESETLKKLTLVPRTQVSPTAGGADAPVPAAKAEPAGKGKKGSPIAGGAGQKTTGRAGPLSHIATQWGGPFASKSESF